MTTRHRNLIAIFAVPIVLAVLSAAGLASALFGDGVWDVASWLTLGSPIAVAAYFAFRRSGQ